MKVSVLYWLSGFGGLPGVRDGSTISDYGNGFLSFWADTPLRFLMGEVRGFPWEVLVMAGTLFLREKPRDWGRGTLVLDLDAEPPAGRLET